MKNYLQAITMLIFMSLGGMMLLSVVSFASHDMTGGGHGMSDCPFMAHQEALCPMTLTEHLDAWKAAFWTSPTNPLLTFFGITGITLAFWPPFFVRKVHFFVSILYLKRQRRFYSAFCRPWQNLFSQGILNPKLYS